MSYRYVSTAAATLEKVPIFLNFETGPRLQEGQSVSAVTF